ncbi:peptidylprolyl isomerase [Streptomyces sp. WAC 00631]|uniref:peptidylprolyl isomerase n=1 Tax=Streptomyces sp. WAC 00631 TaxID=2203201 RepID=UPI000F77A998|nr:peptidylprolyl isomerase [Streptomyces sp. WAC 00631]MCC5034013.1 peptidylprolyl isomerase [Streptomyces sp. WAC 00631]
MATSDQRRRELARKKFERQQERRAQRRRARRRNAVIAAAVAAVLVAGAAAAATAGLGGGDKKKDDAAASPEASATSKAPDPCDEPAGGEPGTEQWKKEPAMTIDTSASYVMELETTCGDIGITMDAEKAPRTVNSFNFLAGEGFFDHTKCHRLTESGIYVLQCGDPKGTGQGGPGYTIPDENLKDPKLKGNVYPAGTVAMANKYNAAEKKGRDSGGSQFFLVYQDSQLPPDYTPFGTVDEEGMKVLKKIADAGAAAPDATQNTAPNATVVINKATVRKS